MHFQSATNIRSTAYVQEVYALHIGHAGASTEDQNLDMRLDALKQAGCGRVYRERASGKGAERLGAAEHDGGVSRGRWDDSSSMALAP